MRVINIVFKTRWSIGRAIRLLLGLAFVIDAYYKSSEVVGFMGAFLIYQSLLNVGCGLGSNTCVPTKEKDAHQYDISHNFIDITQKK